MPVLNGKELRIVGFLCNWCSYGGADTAGVARATQPTDLRIIRVPCSGRIDPLFIVRALLNGADGVLVSGCHPRDCHYSAGNYYARRRLEVLKQFLPVLGIDERRFEYTWVSASEGQRWQHVVTTFTDRIHKLGPAPRFEDPEPLLKVVDMALTSLRPLGTGQNAKLDELKAAIKAKLPELDCVIGWQQGYDAVHTVPLFMRTPEDVDKLVWGPFNVNNPATYLPSFKGKKVGIVVKGCDSRSVVELLQENLINRDDVTIFAMPCEGTLDMARVDKELGRYNKIDSVVYDEAGHCRRQGTPLLHDRMRPGQMLRLHHAHGQAGRHPGRCAHHGGRHPRHAARAGPAGFHDPARTHGLLARPDGTLPALLRLPQRLSHVRVPRLLRGREP